MDMALAIQQVTEDVVMRLARTARELSGEKYLVMAGGVALNCVANGKLLRSGVFDDIWIQPAAGDAGGALGAALAAWHVRGGNERTPLPAGAADRMAGSYLGPEFTRRDALRVASRNEAPCTPYDDFDALCATVADLLADGKVVGWFQGRMEYGPRALGGRSILGDPRNPEMQKKLNLKIKYREGFRPFAPSVLAEAVSECFEQDRPSPYMLLVAPVAAKLRHALPEDYWRMPMFERLYVPRSELPAITHVDFSARIQTVHERTNPRYHKLIKTFYSRHGCPVVVNTSFNVRGEPIVCTPADAYRCFMRTEMDYLVIGDCLFNKEDQPEYADAGDWRDEYELD
jgi:carbamoyltransferase